MSQTFSRAAAIGLFFASVSAHAADPPPTYLEVKQIISERCQFCHSESVQMHGVYDAPGAIKYDSAEEIRAYAKGIMRTVQDRSMPPANATEMTDNERQIIAAWYAAGAATP